MTTVSITRMDGSTEEVTSNQAEVVHGVALDGSYIGLVALADAPIVATWAPPEQGTWAWSVDNQAWLRTFTLEEVKLDGLARIDSAAGQARLRYITDVPGQSGTYLIKAEQAKAFIAASGQGAVPPYVQAEADATGMPPLQAAQYIDAVSTAWADQLGPIIERERRIGKIAVEEATTVEEVYTAQDTAIAILATI